MSRRTLPKIVDELIAAGMPPSTPAVIAADIGRTSERVWRGSLLESIHAADSFTDRAPTLFAVGRCFGHLALTGEMMSDSASGGAHA